jgi:hypothetical protein
VGCQVVGREDGLKMWLAALNIQLSNLEHPKMGHALYCGSSEG